MLMLIVECCPPSLSVWSPSRFCSVKRMLFSFHCCWSDCVFVKLLKNIRTEVLVELNLNKRENRSRMSDWQPQPGSNLVSLL